MLAGQEEWLLSHCAWLSASAAARPAADICADLKSAFGLRAGGAGLGRLFLAVVSCGTSPVVRKAVQARHRASNKHPRPGEEHRSLDAPAGVGSGERAFEAFRLRATVAPNRAMMSLNASVRTGQLAEPRPEFF